MLTKNFLLITKNFFLLTKNALPDGPAGFFFSSL